MKKYLSGLILIILVAGFVGYKPLKNYLTEKPVEKQIEFSIYKKNNYKSKVYRGSSAQIKITIEKVHGLNRETVWDTVLNAKSLKQYPTLDKALSHNITIRNLYDKKEHLEVSYILTYDSKGSELQMQGGAIVVNRKTKLNIEI